MTDSFRSHTRSLTSPAEHALAIQPDDAGDLPQVTRALYVGGSGDVAVTMRVYQHVTAQDDQAAADALARALGSNP